MQVDRFFAHHGIEDNPFTAEEARLDPVFTRLLDHQLSHPDFPKILGRIDKPATAVVFGEKGSGKTALGMLISREIIRHNRDQPDRRVLLVRHDEFNPVLDNVLAHTRQKPAKALAGFRLADHQDAILSQAVTRLTSALLEEPTDAEEAAAVPLPEQADRRLRELPRHHRVDLALLAALYDTPRAGSVAGRWRRLRSKLRLGWHLPQPALAWAAGLSLVPAAAIGLGWWVAAGGPRWLAALGLVLAIVGLGLGGWWGWRQLRLWRLSRQVARETRAVSRSPRELRELLGGLRPADLERQPLPVPAADEMARDSRYELTRRLLDVLAGLDYVGLTVLVDRVDEPTAISGDAEKMKSLIWPVFDNKFLQQEGLGLKLLLPIELRHRLHREGADFFQQARLDKQSMVDRLEWSGATLYDLCTHRLRACQGADAGSVALTDLFESEVTEQVLVDALDQMHQPRDAFKFLYEVIQEHCRLVPDEQATHQIPRLTLESVRRRQSQRVQELAQGLSPS